jgi:hypothetical protein
VTRNAKAISVKVWKFMVPARTPLKGSAINDPTMPPIRPSTSASNMNEMKIGSGR